MYLTQSVPALALSLDHQHAHRPDDYAPAAQLGVHLIQVQCGWQHTAVGSCMHASCTLGYVCIEAYTAQHAAVQLAFNSPPGILQPLSHSHPAAAALRALTTHAAPPFSCHALQAMLQQLRASKAAAEQLQQLGCVLNVNIPAGLPPTWAGLALTHQGSGYMMLQYKEVADTACRDVGAAAAHELHLVPDTRMRTFRTTARVIHRYVATQVVHCKPLRMDCSVCHCVFLVGRNMCGHSTDAHPNAICLSLGVLLVGRTLLGQTTMRSGVAGSASLRCGSNRTCLWAR
jgi:hypothetical protein